jgi:flavin-dependent dehydrogenase
VLDLLIAGGGPIGLATALHADRLGLSAAVIEPRTGPIDKACGEGLMPAAVKALADIGIDPDGRDFSGIRYLDTQRSVDARFRDGVGRGVRRTALHACLTAAVQSRGIEVRLDRVREFEVGSGCVRVGDQRARYLVGADGLHSAVRDIAGLMPASARRRPRWGQRKHFRTAPWTDLVEVYWARDAEAYVTPVARDLVGVAILSTVRRPFAESFAQFPRLAARLAGVPGGAVLGAGPLRQRSTARRSGPVLLVGDAAGYVDALTGEGISVGLAAAQALVECIASGRPQEYEHRWRAVSRRYRLLTEALLWTSRQPSLRRAIVPAATRMPGVYTAIVHQLAR